MSFGKAIEDKSGTIRILITPDGLYYYKLHIIRVSGNPIFDVRPVHNTSVNWGSTVPSQQSVHSVNQRYKIVRFVA